MRGMKSVARWMGVLAAVLLATGLARAQGSRKDDIVLNSRGLPLAGATVRICTSAGTGQPCAPLALIYSDAALTQALANPITTDGMGNYTFYAAPGKYLIEISGPGITTRQMPDVILPSDPTAPSFSSLSSAGAISAFSLSLGGNLGVGGSATVSGATNMNGGGSLAGNFSGNPAFTGLPTFNAASVVSQKPASGDAIRYVSTSGNDSNDGLSWGTAKLTIYGALISLPGGSASPAIAGQGTVYVAPNSSSNPTSSAGIWLMAYTDPNYASPPAGWLRFSGALNIIGVPNSSEGANPHIPRLYVVAGGNADRNHPGIWLSGVQGALHISNLGIKYPGRGVVIGECSDNTRTGTCGVSNVTFDNVSVLLNTSVGYGPGWDITGGSFWLYFYDCGSGGNEISNGLSDDKSAAFLFDGAGNNGNGLIFMRNINTSTGGIKCIPGTNGGCSGAINGMIREGNFASAGMPAVWITSAGANTVGPLELQNIQVADSLATTPAVENDKPYGGSISATGVYGVGKDFIGPLTITDRYSDLSANSPFLQSATGFSGGRVVGQVDVARRSFSPNAVRFVNQALQGTNITCSNYGGGVTRTTGVTGPDGTANAVTCTTVTGGNENIYITPGGSGQWNQTVAVGDWVFAGWWSKSSGTANDINGQIGLLGAGFTCAAIGNAGYASYGGASNTIYVRAYLYGDGEWHWKSVACKIATIGTNPLYTVVAQTFNSTTGETIYAPVLFRVPTGTISDGEAAEILNNLASYPTGAAAGDVAMLPGQRLNLMGNSITNIGSSGTTLSRYARYAVTLSPALVAANTCAAQSFTVTGLQAGDILIAVNKPTEQAGLSVTVGHVTAANTATLNFCNNTAAGITPTASESYSFVAVQ